MEPSVEIEFSALGGLFQHIILDLKNSAPIWEDFLFKANKLHAQLRSTVLASTSFLDAFQKIADMATNTRGATKEIGSALTRLCLRQRSVESKLQIFTNTLQDNLLNPLQDKVEEWKKTANNLDKEHSKEYKRAKQELKKKSSDTLKLQKKVRKVGVVDIRRTLDYALQDVTDKYLLLEEIEKQSVRKALIEERSHFCLFVGFLQPVLESELAMLHEINHIEEVIDTLCKITGDPHLLPSTSEQVIHDVKKSEHSWTFHSTPPGSPGSLGSRKSSVCSISSINSSSSGSLKSHSSRKLSHSQVQTLGRKHLNSVASQDSGFTSQDTLFYNSMGITVESSSQLSTFQENRTPTFSTPSSPVPPTWPNLQDPISPEKDKNTPANKYQRPHTISSAYEKSNQRPALTVHTFLPLDQNSDYRENYATVGTFKSFGNKFKNRNCSSQPGTPVYSKPSLPERSDISCRPKPSLPEKSASIRAKHDKLYNEPNKSVPDFNRTLPDQVVPHPIYANAADLARKKSLSQEIYSSTEECRNEVQSRKEFAAVLNEGLLMQSKWIRSDQSSFSESESSAPSVPRHCRNSRVSSETLPRSRESLCEDQILEWQINNLTLSNDSCLVIYHNNQRRPMSIAGMSPGFLLPRKASTLQRIGSANGPKPPAPIRRSSSITTSVSHGKISEANNISNNKKEKNPQQSLTSGAGEVCYSPSPRDFKRSHSTLSNSSIPERYANSLRHVETNNGSDSCLIKDSESSIVTDVSDSRARLIHDLNSALKKPNLKKQSQADVPAVPARNASKREKGYNNCAKQDDLAGNALYAQCAKKERSGHTYSAKPVASQSIIQRQSHQKPRLKECLSQGDLLVCAKDWDQTFKQKNGCSNDLPDNDSLLKRSFVVALNAKLAEQQRLDSSVSEEKPHIAPWLKNNNKIYQSWNDTGFRRLPPQVCRESLMDQIKRGKKLRRVTSNDRSSPRFA